MDTSQSDQDTAGFGEQFPPEFSFLVQMPRSSDRPMVTSSISTNAKVPSQMNTLNVHDKTLIYIHRKLYN